MVFSGISRPIVPVATKAAYAELVCNAVFSAGAMTSAKRMGVIRGTSSSLGVLAVSCRRRRASVASGDATASADGRRAVVAAGAIAVIGVSFLLGFRRLR